MPLWMKLDFFCMDITGTLPEIQSLNQIWFSSINIPILLQFHIRYSYEVHQSSLACWHRPKTWCSPTENSLTASNRMTKASPFTAMWRSWSARKKYGPMTPPAHAMMTHEVRVDCCLTNNAYFVYWRRHSARNKPHRWRWFFDKNSIIFKLSSAQFTIIRRFW